MTTPRRAQVRPLAQDDLPQIATLHHRLMSPRARAPESFFAELFLNSPFARKDTPSLVFADANGAIAGFLGVMPRTLMLGKATITSAFVTKFIVDPETRSSMAALQMFRQFLQGPQILSYADILNDQGCAIFRACGGSTVPLYELEWRQQLRWTPSRKLRSRLRGIVGKCASVTYPVLDKVAAACLPSRVPRGQDLTCVPFDAENIAATLQRTVSSKALRPAYEASELDWLLQFLRQDPEVNVAAVGLQDPEGTLVGWFAYHFGNAKHAQVLQLASHPNKSRAVFDELCRHAAAKGALQITSRVEPLWLTSLANRPGLTITPRDYSMAIHSKDPAVRDTFLRGDVMLTPLEGELSTQYHGERSPQ